MPSEASIKNAIETFLSYHENRGALTFVRNNTFSGTIQRRNGTTGYMKNGKVGSPDIICLRHGTAYGFEIKSPTGRQSPEQLKYQQLWEHCGGTYHLVRSIDDVSSILFPEK